MVDNGHRLPLEARRLRSHVSDPHTQRAGNSPTPNRRTGLIQRSIPFLDTLTLSVNTQPS
ncbi:hypothetical protein RSAG8_13754, partial [Rhizoctonia solani AG-8 WAC10335]